MSYANRRSGYSGAPMSQPYGEYNESQYDFGHRHAAEDTIPLAANASPPGFATPPTGFRRLFNWFGNQ
jgi:hypothetical protein